MANDRHQSGVTRDGNGNSASEFLQSIVDVAGRFTIASHDSLMEGDKVVEHHAAAADGRVFALGDDYESVFEQN